MASRCRESHATGAQATMYTQGSWKSWFLESSLSWTPELECRNLTFMWSLGPLLWLSQRASSPFSHCVRPWVRCATGTGTPGSIQQAEPPILDFHTPGCRLWNLKLDRFCGSAQGLCRADKEAPTQSLNNFPKSSHWRFGAQARGAYGDY